MAGRKIRLPSLDRAELVAGAPGLRGEFDLTRVAITGSTSAGVTGEGSIAESVLSNLDLSGSRLAPLELSNVHLVDTELSNATLPATTARRVHVEASRGIGLHLVFRQASDVLAEGCRFDYATIELERVKQAVVFQGCSFREAMFLGDLSTVAFVECDLEGAEFAVRRAADCDLRSSNLRAVRGLRTLAGAKISTEQAVAIAVGLATQTGLVVEDQPAGTAPFPPAGRGTPAPPRVGA